MAIEGEFATIKLIRDSDAETRGVDCFALSLIKAERQMRRLITYLVFQSPSFHDCHIVELRDALAEEKLYFQNLRSGWDKLYTKPLSELVPEHDCLVEYLEEAKEIRNKIFHGQLTNKQLTREDLLRYVTFIERWCEGLAHSAKTEVGYDGIDRSHPNGSFHKQKHRNLDHLLLIDLRSVNDYKAFLATLRPRG